MSDAFREMFEGLRDTAEALIVANTALKKMADAALQAREDFGDVRETVHRMEERMLESADNIRVLRSEVAALRERLNGNHKP